MIASAMKPPPATPVSVAGLRRQAKARLQELQLKHPPRPPAPISATDSRRLLHELQVHQMELEMQNAELQQARDHLEVALESYTSLYDFAPVGYFTLTASGLIRFVNLTGAGLVGMERSKLVGRSLGQFLPAGQRQHFSAYLMRVFGSETKQSGDFELLGRSRPPLNVNIEAQRVDNGQECRAVVVDITERKRGEESLRRNEALFSALIAQVPVGIFVVNARFQVQQVNLKALPVFKNVRPLLDRDLSEAMRALWPRRVADEIVERFRHTLKTGEPYLSPEFHERRQDTGEKEFYEWQIQRVLLPAGEQGVVCFFSDITARKRAEGVQRRMELIGSANLKLRREIVRRQAMEMSLKYSQQQQHRLLTQSRRAQARLRFLSRKVLRAQEEERRRISRELHDVIAQTLTTINVRLAALKQNASRDVGGIGRSIARTQRMVEKSVNVVHTFARELRPPVLDDLGLIPALHAFVKLFSKRTRLHVHLKVFAGIERMNILKRTVLYRVAQEALNNVASHANASRVEVSIEKLDRAARMEIRDDGKSFNVSRALNASGNSRLGLLGMRERVDMVGGVFGVESAPGHGTIVRVEIPFTSRGRQSATKKSISSKLRHA